MIRRSTDGGATSAASTSGTTIQFQGVAMRGTHSGPGETHGSVPLPDLRSALPGCVHPYVEPVSPAPSLLTAPEYRVALQERFAAWQVTAESRP